MKEEYCQGIRSSSSKAETQNHQCLASRKRRRDEKHPSYHGVRMRNWGRWVSEIREPRKKSRIWLGTYTTAEMAARAHDVAELTIKGLAAAHLNFPQLVSQLPRPASTSPKDIQVAAAKAAATVGSFHPTARVSGESTSSSSADKEDKLFDLPDLFLGLDDVSCFYSSSSSSSSSSSLWVTTPEHYCGGSTFQFQVDDDHPTFFWESSSN